MKLIDIIRDEFVNIAMNEMTYGKHWLVEDLIFDRKMSIIHAGMVMRHTKNRFDFWRARI